MDLAKRSTLPELMDDPALPEAEYARCLADLAKVNRATLTHRATLAWLGRATRELPRGATFSVLDVAYGGGDLLRLIHRWATRRGFRPALSGIDLNPRSAAFARAATPPDWNIRFDTGDVFAQVPAPRPDFIVTSQFAHHLDEATLLRLLGWLEANAGRGWFIADLQRHRLAYHGYRLLAAAAGWHRIVRHDGAVSVASAFRRADWHRLLEQAGLRVGLQAELRWHLPFRLCVGRLR